MPSSIVYAKHTAFILRDKLFYYLKFIFVFKFKSLIDIFGQFLYFSYCFNFNAFSIVPNYIIHLFSKCF